MKILIKKSNFKLGKFSQIKKFSVLQDFSANLRMNCLFKAIEIHESKVAVIDNIKKKE